MDCLKAIHDLSNIGPVMSACYGSDWVQKAIFGFVCLIVIILIAGVLTSLIQRIR